MDFSVNLSASYIISPVGGDKGFSLYQWLSESVIHRFIQSNNSFKNHCWVLLRDAQATVNLAKDSFETIFVDGVKIDKITVNIVSKR